MVIVLQTFIFWWFFSFRAALVSLVFVVVVTVWKAWVASYAIKELDPAATDVDRKELFRMMMFGMVTGAPNWSTQLWGIIVGAGFHYFTKK